MNKNARKTYYITYLQLFRVKRGRIPESVQQVNKKHALQTELSSVHVLSSHPLLFMLLCWSYIVFLRPSDSPVDLAKMKKTYVKSQKKTHQPFQNHLGEQRQFRFQPNQRFLSVGTHFCSQKMSETSGSDVIDEHEAQLHLGEAPQNDVMKRRRDTTSRRFTLKANWHFQKVDHEIAKVELKLDFSKKNILSNPLKKNDQIFSGEVLKLQGYDFLQSGSKIQTFDPPHGSSQPLNVAEVAIWLTRNC